MKHLSILLATFIIVLEGNLHSQLISKFDWNSNPVTQSQYGPNALSVSGSATSSPNGVGGTNGLNPGLPKADVELLLPAAAFMNIGGIDFRVDFQRDESRGDFITCGTTFAFGIDGGELFVMFEIEDNLGGSEVKVFNNLFTVPDDDIFRTYRFYYLPSNGYAEILVDENVVWSFSVGYPSNLVWSNNDVMIGYLMDGNGYDKTIFDNVIIGEVYDSALPVEMSIFEVSSIGDKVEVKWKTESELDNDYFTVERSQDGENFYQLKDIKGAGTTNESQSYVYLDENPLSGISYYRIVQTDFNGKSSESEVLSVQFQIREGILIFPNLLRTNEEFQIKLPYSGEETQVIFINNLGTKVLNEKFSDQNYLKMNAPSFSGTYIVHVNIDGELFGNQKIVVR